MRKTLLVREAARALATAFCCCFLEFSVAACLPECYCTVWLVVKKRHAAGERELLHLGWHMACGCRRTHADLVLKDALIAGRALCMPTRWACVMCRGRAPFRPRAPAGATAVSPNPDTGCAARLPLRADGALARWVAGWQICGPICLHTWLSTPASLFHFHSHFGWAPCTACVQSQLHIWRRSHKRNAGSSQAVCSNSMHGRLCVQHAKRQH